MSSAITAKITVPSPFSQFLARHTGLYFPPERWPDLMSGMDRAAREFGLQDSETCMQWLLSTPMDRHRVEILARYLTVAETYFFRDPAVFEALKTSILPGLIQSRRLSRQTLDIWCAGCATGEEAYSLAILMQRILPDFQQWRISLSGTDINPQALAKAEAGVYREWSFRNPPVWLKTGYFRETATGCYEILPSVRDMVRFSYFNLMADSDWPPIGDNGTMDFIFCRNVLMYFQPELAGRVLNKLCRSLADGGWLIIGPSEAPITAPENMERHYFPGTILYRKNLSTTVRKPAAAHTAALFPPKHTGLAAAGDQKPSVWQLAAKTARKPAKGPPGSPGPVMPLCQQKKLGVAGPEDTRRPSGGETEPSAGDADRLSPGRQYLQAVELLERGQTEAGEQALKRTLYLEPAFTPAYFMLGCLLRRQGRHKEAVKNFKNALQLLEAYPPEQILPEAEGVTAGRLAEIIRTLNAGEECI